MTGKFAQVAIALSIFISSYIFFKSPFEAYFSYLVMALFFPGYLTRYRFPKEALLVFLTPLISGIVYLQTGDNEPALFFKIFIGFFASVIFYRYVFEAFEFDIEKLFSIYLKGAYVVSLLGLFQLISYNIGFKIGYDYSWVLNKWSYTQGGIGIRMNSVFSEPAYFAGVVGPAFFLAVHNLIKGKHQMLTKRQALIIVIAYPLTFSTLGILSIFVTGILLLVNFGFFKYAIIFGPIMYFGYNYAYDNVPEFRERIEGTTTVFGDEGISDINKVHGSSFVLYNNYVVAYENFKRNPFFGTGLGSHPVAFEKYSLTNRSGVIKIDFNKADANSMFLRLMSETGLYGLGVMLFLVIRNYVPKRKSANDMNWVISNAVLVVILVYLSRQGHYFINGFPFFLWLYYFVRKRNSAQLEENARENDAQSTQHTQPELLKAS